MASLPATVLRPDKNGTDQSASKASDAAKSSHPAAEAKIAPLKRETELAAAAAETGGAKAPSRVAVGTAPASSSTAPPTQLQEGMEDDSHFCEPLEHEKELSANYEKLGAPVGEGTYGTVWKGRCTRTGQEVAMKKVVLRYEREGFPTTAVREVRALRRLKHHNVVSLLDVWAEPSGRGASGPGDAYLIFEYAPHDLAGYMHYRKKLKMPEIKCIVRQLTDALDFCHLNNIMHRDLKPSNILLTGKGELKLCDFGLSRTFGGAGNYSTRVITLWYRPPELLLGAKHYDARVDVWSAGCIFGELLAGTPLFPDSTEIQVFKKIRQRCAAHNPEQWPEDIRKLPLWDKFFAPPGSKAAPPPLDRDFFAELRTKHGSAAVELLKATLHLDPIQRIGSDRVAAHPFFDQEPLPCKPAEIKMPAQHVSCKELDVKRRREKQEEEKAEKEAKQQKRPAEGQSGNQGRGGGGALVEPSPKRHRPP
mmetsp:Transcript_73427/g.129567  ORF Transcript_73427/g.129567 Transcript_73427/m.129567 type:complete len:478 (-) Transcript_73427:60-1493(-)